MTINLNIEFFTENGILFSNDCLDVLKSLKSNSIQTVFADPPFNLGKNYNNGNADRMNDKLYIDWCKSWLIEFVRILKDGGSLFVYNLPKWNILLASFLMNVEPMLFRNWIAISIKNGPPRGKKLYPAHYSMIYFTKGEPHVFNRDNVRNPIPLCRHCGKPIPDWGGYKNCVHPLGVNLTDVWTDINPVRHRKYKSRPKGINELDQKIPERVILLTTNPGDIILDPFGGGGGTYAMAEKHNRYWIGTEIGDCQPIKDILQMNGKNINPKEFPKKILNIFNIPIKLPIQENQPLQILS